MKRVHNLIFWEARFGVLFWLSARIKYSVSWTFSFVAVTVRYYQRRSNQLIELPIKRENIVQVWKVSTPIGQCLVTILLLVFCFLKIQGVLFGALFPLTISTFYSHYFWNLWKLEKNFTSTSSKSTNTRYPNTRCSVLQCHAPCTALALRNLGGAFLIYLAIYSPNNAAWINRV